MPPAGGSLIVKAKRGSMYQRIKESLSQEQGEALRALFRSVDQGEQEVSRQASRNAQLSLALLDQSSRTLQALTSRAMPPRAETYGRRGGMRPEMHPQAAIISGRL